MPNNTSGVLPRAFARNNAGNKEEMQLIFSLSGMRKSGETENKYTEFYFYAAKLEGRYGVFLSSFRKGVRIKRTKARETKSPRNDA